jgi:hypothetical protein
MAKDYALEKLYLASLSLASGLGDVNDRLEMAATGLSVLRPESDIPDEFRGEFNSIWQAMTNKKAEIEGEGTIHATIRQMDPEDAKRLADRIFHLYVHLLHGNGL